MEFLMEWTTWLGIAVGGLLTGFAWALGRIATYASQLGDKIRSLTQDKEELERHVATQARSTYRPLQVPPPLPEGYPRVARTGPQTGAYPMGTPEHQPPPREIHHKLAAAPAEPMYTSSGPAEATPTDATESLGERLKMMEQAVVQLIGVVRQLKEVAALSVPRAEFSSLQSRIDELVAQPVASAPQAGALN